MNLSIYCGLRAIGWIADDGEKVVKHGIKRLNVPFDHYYEFINGLPVTARISRREKRQMRRNRWRNLSRRNSLEDYLQSEGFTPLRNLNRDEILQLRVEALTKKLISSELATVLMSLQKKRGYKSLRGVSDNENSDYLKEIEKHTQALSQFRSVAEYLLTLSSSKNIIFLRESYINEFNAIMAQQELPEKFIKKVYGLIYYQNPLRAGKVSMCAYEDNRRVQHASHPLYQKFRIWRDVNNIILWDQEENEVEIPFEARQQWAKKLMSGTKLTKAACCKDLGIKKSTGYTWLSGKALEGNIHSQLAGLDVDSEQLWQELYSAVDNEGLKLFLKSKYRFDDYTTDRLCDIDFSKMGWGNYSARCIKKVLPLLETGKKLKESLLEVYGQVDFNTVELRNWMVEKHYHAYESLLKKLLVKYPEANVKFEIDYSLKDGNKGRKAKAKAKRKEAKKAKEHPKLSSYQLLKIRLWEETEGYSPYVLEKISTTDLFTDKWSVDHIVPKSKLFASGYANTVLCPTALNEEKSNHYTGIEFAEQLGVADHYKKIADQLKGDKKKFMLMRFEDIPTNEISKLQNNDYNTKCFNTLHPDAVNIPNKLITKYMKLWKVNDYDDQDARHYLSKAWVLANMDQSTVNYFDRLKEIDKDPYRLEPILPKIDFSTSDIFLQKPKYTRKQGEYLSPRVNLHKETIYGRRPEKVRNSKGELMEKDYFQVRHPLDKLTENMFKNMVQLQAKAAIQKRINKKGSLAKALESHSEDPITYNGKPIQRVSIKIAGSKLVPLRSKDGAGHTGGKKLYASPTDYAYIEGYHRLILSLDERGKLKFKPVSVLEAIDDFNSGSEAAPSGSFALKKNDIVELEGRRYFLIGASQDSKVRDIYTLSATNERTLKVADWVKIKKILVNELGEEVGTKCLSDGHSQN